jgi:hypothetical protein
LVPDQQYNLELVATSAMTGCKDSIVKHSFITTYPTPQAAFRTDKQIFTTDQPKVPFFNESIGADRYVWSFGDDANSLEENPVHQYNTVGNRLVLLEATNNFGCSDTASLKISIALNRIYTPNAFSPNARNLIDKEFKLFANGVIEEGYHLKILSRWNDVVFECKNEIKGWDGSLSNGTMAQPGNYIWILEFTDFLGMPHRQMGSVMLVY